MHTYSSSILAGKPAPTAAVVGARGYTGLETVRLLLQHPGVQLTHCFATTEFSLKEQFAFDSRFDSISCLGEGEILKHHTDYVFLATPAETSLSLAPKLLQQNRKVIDLSGAFRLKKHNYQTWYNFQHTEAELLKNANYGLVPFAKPKPDTALVANPGCYATACVMGLVPLLKKSLIDANNIVIDAKSGASGAGRKASENLLFTEVSEECLPYKIGQHQHLPEITEAVEQYSGVNIDLQFVTSLLPIRRGIIAGIYGKVKAGTTLADVHNAFAECYANEPLVRFASTSEAPSLLSLKKVLGTARTHISFNLVDNKLFVFVCIDNLMKGAASQAIENFNRLQDYPSNTGLSHLEAIV